MGNDREYKMNRCMTFAVAALALAALGGPAAGQVTGAGPATPGGAGTVGLGNHMGQNNMTQDEFNKVADYADNAKRLTKEDKAKGKTLKDLLAEDLANAAALAKSMPLSCDVTEAILAAEGPASLDGKTVDTKTYEAACANGMGYFLISQEPGKAVFRIKPLPSVQATSLNSELVTLLMPAHL